MPTPAATPIERASSAAAAPTPASTARRDGAPDPAGRSSAQTIAPARRSPNSGSDKRAVSTVRTGIARLAAATTAAASQRGASGPSSSRRVACHPMSPAPTAASPTLSTFPARAAAATGRALNSGARSRG